MDKESIHIVLNTYKNGHITEEEAITLIKDIFNVTNTIISNPSPVIYPSSWPQITYDLVPKFQKYEVTCKTE